MGDASVKEYLQCLYNEENEPGVTHPSVYLQFPADVSYSTSTVTEHNRWKNRPSEIRDGRVERPLLSSHFASR